MCLGFAWGGRRKQTDKDCQDKMSESWEECGDWEKKEGLGKSQRDLWD